MTIPTWTDAINIINADYAAGRNRLQEISERQFDEMLGAVPPVRQTATGYVCGEPYDFNDNGDAVYYCGLYQEGKYYMVLWSLSQFDAHVFERR